MDYIEKERLKYDKQEEQEVLHCQCCGISIYEGEDYFETDIGDLCEDCFEEEYLKVERERCKKTARKDDENGEY